MLCSALVDARSVDGFPPSTPSTRWSRAGPTSHLSTRARNRLFCSSSKHARESNLPAMRSSICCKSVIGPEVEGFGSLGGERGRALASESLLTTSSRLSSSLQAPLPAGEHASSCNGAVNIFHRATDRERRTYENGSALTPLTCDGTDETNRFGILDHYIRSFVQSPPAVPYPFLHLIKKTSNRGRSTSEHRDPKALAWRIKHGNIIRHVLIAIIEDA